MTDKIYTYMDWPQIEGIIYSDQKHPKKILAPRTVKEGTLVQGFFPEAKKVSAVNEESGKSFPMKMEDESGWFAAILPGRKIPGHYFMVDGEKTGNPYAFENLITAEEEGEFCAGIGYEFYKKLGAHKMACNGTEGVLFALWAPNAIRVSVVGPFNRWDGRVNPMEFHEDSGIYELFIPYLEDGTLYKYELKLATGLTYLRPDPCGSEFEVRPDNASVVSCDEYRWHDREYLHERKKSPSSKVRPLSIYEMSLGTWKKKEDGSFYTYRELAPLVSSYVRDMGYTHIELMPVMEYPDDSTSGYQTTGYFAPTSRFGRPEDFKYFVDTMHKSGIGVILDWTPSQFSPAPEGLTCFDGTCLYEHLDPRQGTHPIWHTKLWNYGRPQVRNFLISNAFFWIREFHADGLRMDGVSTILRLDYGRADGQWVPNMYGSYENLEGIQFLKHLNGVLEKAYPDVLMILEEDVDWPDTTGDSDENHLGFDYKWNLHFTEDILRYFSAPPEERSALYDMLTETMLWHYLDDTIISLSRDITLFDPEKLMGRLPGTEEEKKAALRAAYAFLTVHPGKKLFSAGEDFDPAFFRALLKMYREEPALYEMDYQDTGFEWINSLDRTENIISFLRKTGRKEDTILVVCHFGSDTVERYRTGVPFAGTYREILSTDSTVFGGSGLTNERAKVSRPTASDERENSILIRLAPLSVAVFKASPAKEVRNS